MPRFVPTDEERALVKLLTANGFARHVVCQYIRNHRGSHISESTLKRAFANELKVGKVELDTIVLTQFMAAIMRGERWAICKYMDQRMWRPESGGWRPGGVKLGLTPESAVPEKDSGVPPLQLIVQFEAPDPRLKPVL
jgi:hypothetical protein